MKEVWKPVIGYEGWYEVSDQGRIKRVRGGRGARAGAVLKLLKHNCGYSLINLSVEGVRTQKLVHILVCAAFHGPRPSPAHEVNHISGKKRVNCVSNLEWLSRKEHVLHTLYVLQKRRKLQDTDVVDIRQRYVDGESQTKLAKEYQVRQNTISLIVIGESFPELGGPISAPLVKKFLTASEVAEIRRRSKAGETRVSVSKDFGCSAVQVSRIARGVNHKTRKRLPARKNKEPRGR